MKPRSMSGRMRVFASLRRRKIAVARIVLPLLACVWINASVSSCLAMATATFIAEAAHEPEHVHEPEHAHERGHAHDRADLPPNAGCPHCPSSMDGSEAAEHAACGVSAAPTGLGSTTKGSQWDPAPSVAAANAPQSSALSRPRSAPRASAAGPPCARIPLNLRHCVFLI